MLLDSIENFASDIQRHVIHKLDPNVVHESKLSSLSGTSAVGTIKYVRNFNLYDNHET